MALIRELRADDLPRLAAVEGGGPAWHGHWDHWPRYLAEHEAGERVVFVAEDAGAPVGYASLIWRPLYPPFAAEDTPEISDMVVVEGLRGQGIGSALIAACEARARAAGKRRIGIGFALYADYGRAQRLYVRRGFTPDGRGVWYGAEPAIPGQTYRLDDDLVLFLTKAI
jgi:GNAT superfamily N-acetyltransferase